MKTRIVTLLVGLLLTAPAARAEENPLAWSLAHRRAAQLLSDATVWTNISAETIAAWRAPDRRHALACQAFRTGVALGSTELTKRLVHRTRPDGSNRLSFFSGHTALAFVNTGWRYQVSVPIALGTGYLRSAGNKHYISDVIVGGFVGALSTRVCQ